MPTLATVSPAGEPEARTVVLRAVDRDAGRLELHTDVRSGKVASLRARPVAALCFYTPRHRLQLRARGTVTIHAVDARSAEAWARTPPASQATYLTRDPPGTPLDGDAPARDPDAGAERLAVLELAVEQLDWLLLRSASHQRAALTRGPDGRWQAQALVP